MTLKIVARADAPSRTARARQCASVPEAVRLVFPSRQGHRGGVLRVRARGRRSLSAGRHRPAQRRTMAARPRSAHSRGRRLPVVLVVERHRVAVRAAGMAVRHVARPAVVRAPGVLERSVAPSGTDSRPMSCVSFTSSASVPRGRLPGRPRRRACRPRRPSRSPRRRRWLVTRPRLDEPPTATRPTVGYASAYDRGSVDGSRHDGRLAARALTRSCAPWNSGAGRVVASNRVGHCRARGDRDCSSNVFHDGSFWTSVDGSSSTSVDGTFCTTVAPWTVATRNRAGESVAALAALTVSVVDAQGTVLPGTRITLVDVSTQAAAEAIANAEGRVRFTNLNRGEYELRISRPGFRAVTSRTSITGNDTSLELTLRR